MFSPGDFGPKSCLGFPSGSAGKESACHAGEPSSEPTSEPWTGNIPWRRDRIPTLIFTGIPGGSDGKGSSCQILWETWVRSLDWEDPLEGGMATHSSTLAWRIPWTEEPGGLHSMGSQSVGHK